MAAGWDVIGVDVKDMGGYQGHLLLEDVKLLTQKRLNEFQTEKFRTVRAFLLVVASPPCNDFSYSSLPFKKARAKFSNENPPDDSIWRACERLAVELDAPFILENVRGAKKWMGHEDWRYGSFYFWGETPALLPSGCPRKGFGGGGRRWDERRRKGYTRESSGLFQNRKPFPGEYERVEGLKKSPGMPFGYKRDGSLKKSPFATPSERVNAMKLKDRKIGGAEQIGHHKISLREQWSARAAMIPIELAQYIGNIFYPRDRAGLI